MDGETKTYDAVIFGPALAQGNTHPARINAALDVVEPHLGGKGFIRALGPGRYLATRSPADKLLFDQDHETRALTPRYTFEDGPNGLKLGTLVDGAIRHA